jgi:membrane associated rhomboid family serine protease
MAAPHMQLADDTDRPWTGPRRPAWNGWSVTTWLIAINIAVFILQEFFRPRVDEIGAFTVTGALGHVQLWRFISCQFLHDTSDPLHLIFNMLALYFFGPIVEARLKKARFLIYYLLCGIGGAVVFWVLYRMNILNVSSVSPLIGASGAVLGVAAGVAKLMPNQPIRLLFPPISLRMITIIWGYFLIAVYTTLTAGHNAGGEAAHLGGLIVGFVLIRNPKWLWMPVGMKPAAARKFWKPGDPPEKFFRQDP